MSEMKKNNYLNDALKKRAEEKKNEAAESAGEVKLDDLSRVKVLSPARKVFKRFMRNRLAVFGAYVLIAMFLFAFVGPLFYPYGQKQVFNKYDTQNINYAQAKKLASYTGYPVGDEVDVPSPVNNMMNSYIKSMIETGEETKDVVAEGAAYSIKRIEDGVYSLSAAESEEICTAGVSEIKAGVFSRGSKSFEAAEGVELPEGLDAYLAENGLSGQSGEFEFGGVKFNYSRSANEKTKLDVFTHYEGVVYAGSSLGEEFEKAVLTAIEKGESALSFDGTDYLIANDGDSSRVFSTGEFKTAKVFTSLVLDKHDQESDFTDEMRVGALLAAGGEGVFSVGGKDYSVEKVDEYLIVKDSDGKEIAEFSPLSIRRQSGQDTIEYDLKRSIASAIEEMDEKGVKTATIVHDIPLQDSETGQQMLDEEGNVIVNSTEMLITRTDTGVYNVTCDQVLYLIDRYAPPSATHILGTDGDGFDVFARIMYGGRISLLVGFVVIFLEIIIGVILGGLAGFYGKWVDMIIMRLVDIFYCIPSMPILIIFGVLMDYQRLNPYLRLFVMMAILGLLGWAGVARMVRGQILSLREQEFMTAAEATGIKTSTRIFKHLIPNVMPQLIVIATMGIGGVIITESTLSFLGLGVKHPLATWGTMINSVSSQQAVKMYPYIWIPVGLLICITVVAFNFVGDGLRDAYDPRSKK